MHLGKREWLRVRGRGVHHYYVQTLRGFIQKRRRAMVHFLNVRGDTDVSWMKQKPPIPGWLACAYCVSFFGPIYHTLVGMIRDRDCPLALASAGQPRLDRRNGLGLVHTS